MTLKRLFFSYRTVGFAVSITALASAQAGFQYNARDLVFGFRDGGTSELVVDAGPASTYYNLAVGNELIISNVTTQQLSDAFLDLNNLSFSAGADVRITSDPTYPFNTIWVTQARTDINVQTTPWQRRGQTQQGTTVGKIEGIVDPTVGAVAYANSISTGPDNTSYGVIIPSDDPGHREYSTFMGSGNYAGTFPGVVELTTPPDFTTAGQVVRADFYQLKPGTGNGTYLGYFEFSPSGVMKYHSGASGSVTIPRPTITAIQRTGTTSTITFTTVSGGTYTLLYTDSAGLATPVSTWTSGNSIAGDGTNKSLSDTSTGTVRFYAISAH